MKYVTNDQTMKEWDKDFWDIDFEIWSDDSCIANIISCFKWMTTWSRLLNERSFIRDRGFYKNLCEDYKNVRIEDRGDVSLFIRFVIRMIDKNWMTKDEVIDILRDFPDTDVLVEVIKYDKPLCVNRWEI